MSKTRPSLQDQMLAEIEALRQEIAPDIPDCAMTFEEILQSLGPNAKENKLHDWLARAVEAGSWKKARAKGGKARTVYWKVG
jgi:hypothetical protein